MFYVFIQLSPGVVIPPPPNFLLLLMFLACYTNDSVFFMYIISLILLFDIKKFRLISQFSALIAAYSYMIGSPEAT